MKRRTTCGRKVPVKDGSGMRDREEVEAFRRGLRDFDQRHGRDTKSIRQAVSSGTKGRKVTRLRTGSWETKFICSLARTGEIRAAARFIGIRPATAEARIQADPAFHAKAWAALGEYALRMLRQLAKGQTERWELSSRTAKALLSAMEGEESRS